MDKNLKIMMMVVVVLGIISGAFLLFAKKTKAPVAVPKTVQTTAQVKSLTPLPVEQDAAAQKKQATAQVPTTPQAKKPQASVQDQKALAASQWTQCKAKTFAATTNLFWSVQIAEGIPTGGAYAKGTLNGNVALPVRVIIKSDSKIVDKIKAMLVVGKSAFLRGNCTDVTADGAVVLQAF